MNHRFEERQIGDNELQGLPVVMERNPELGIMFLMSSLS